MSWNRRVALVGLLAAALLAPAARSQCTGPNCHEFTTPTNVYDGNGGPWLSGHTYVLNSTITVPAGQTLTIQPGAIVKTGSNVLFGITAWGDLQAVGVQGNPIVFTSLKDDIGGDHNGDGGASSPAPGDWPGIVFGAGAPPSELTWCELRYGGVSGVPMLDVIAPGLVMKNTLVEFGGGDGVRFNTTLAGLVQDCAFDFCQRPLSGVSALSVDVVKNCTATGNAQGDVLWANSTGSATFNTNVTWQKTNTLNDNGVIHLWKPITVSVGATLTVGQGVKVKFLNSSGFVNVFGTLVTQGAAGDEVVFTSIGDDQIGGDSAGDGPTTGQPGDWRIVQFNFNQVASTMSHTWLRFGGYQSQSLASVANSDVTIDQCRFEHSASAGFSPSIHKPTVSGCQFNDNAEEAIDQVAIDALAGFTNNTASGNGAGDAIVLGGGVLPGSLTLNAASAFNGTGAFVVASTITVGSAGVLTLAPNVVLKFAAANAGIKVDGVLSVDAQGGPVVLTSIHDDTYGGDLNANGAATTPSPGDWSGIEFAQSAGASVVKHARVRYAGSGSVGSLRLGPSDPTFEGVVVEHGAGAGLDGKGSSQPTVTGCAFDNNGGAPIVGISLAGVTGFTGNTAAGNGGGDAMRFGFTNVLSPLALQKAYALNGSGVFVLTGDVQTTSSGSLTLGAGVVMKWAAGKKLTANSPLVATGTASEPVVFTSLGDDSYGGDSAGDGPTTGAKGDWWGLILSNHAGSSLTHARIRYAGYVDQAALRCVNSDAALDNVTFELAQGDGLELFMAYPTVTDCAFDQCRRPAANVPAAALAGFTGNTGSGNLEGDAIRIAGAGTSPTPPTSIDKSMSLNGAGVFVVTQSTNFANNEAVNIGKGVVLRFVSGTEMTFGGTLNVNGSATEPVVFTSDEDDAFGGDATGNGNVPPMPGDWKGLRFFGFSDDSVLNHVIVRYAGEGGAAAIELTFADPTFCDLVVEHSLGVAIDANGNSAPTLKNVDIDDNGGEAVDGVTWGVLGKFDNVNASNNGGGDATVIDSPFVGDDIVIDKEDYFGQCIVVTVSPDPANTGGSLSFTEGVVVKAHAGVLIPAKHLRGTGLEKVRFTSIKDDTIAGDTNGDGAATTSAPGDWMGVRAGAVDGTCEHVLVRYAGEPVPAFPQPQEVALSGYHAFSVRAEHSAGDGVACTTGDNIVAFENARDGVVGNSVTNSTAVKNGRFGINTYTATYCIAWNNGDGSEVANYAYTGDHVLGPMGCNPIYSCGTTLSVGPGTGFNGNCGSSGWGNVYADPQFVDEAGGDLRLKANSPCLNYVLVPPNPIFFQDNTICTPWGQQGAFYPSDPPTTRDHLEFPRLIDDDLGGPNPLLADLGAHERAVFTLDVGGTPRVGEVFTMTTNGPAGSAIYFLGVDGGGDVLVGGVGYLLMNPALVLQLVTVPVGLTLPLPIPDEASYVGLKVNFQAGGVKSAGPNPGTSLTNVYRMRILG